MMKSLIIAVFSFHITMIPQILCASQAIRSVSSEKVYVNPQFVHLSTEGIFIEIDPYRYTPVPALMSDENGLYAPRFTMVNSARSAYIYCNRCEVWVEIYAPSVYCPQCGKKLMDQWPQKNG